MRPRLVPWGLAVLHLSAPQVVCGGVVASGVVVAQVVSNAGAGAEGPSIGQGAGVGLIVGGIVASAITAFGTSIFKPWLESRGYKAKADELAARVEANSAEIVQLRADLAAADVDRRTLARDAESRNAEFVARVGDLTEKNIRLLHQLLVVTGRQRPGEPPPASKFMIDDADAAPAGGPTVLLVEDAPGPREAMTQLLGRFGFRVEAVGTLAEGIEALDRHPDYVVLDLMLPDGPGEDLLRKVRDEGRKAKVVVVTGSDPAGLARVRALAPSALLLKPFDLFADLLPALGRRPAGGPTP